MIFGVLAVFWYDGAFKRLRLSCKDRFQALWPVTECRRAS